MRGAALVLGITAVVALAVSLVVSSRRSADDRGLRSQLLLDLDRGGIADLGRAQALGRRLSLADPKDREAAAGLAFADAALAVDYGLETGREAEAALARMGPAPTGSEASASGALADAARALLSARAGDRAAAVRTAAAAAAAAPGVPYPLYALGRARALGGDLVGAGRAYEAAIVGDPNFSAARVAWAEVRLDLGDAATARSTLQPVFEQSPKNLRAGLLLAEAEVALGSDPTGTLARACLDERWVPASIAVACAVAEAARARRQGARAVARTRLEAVPATAPGEPRLLAHAAELLAQLGEVDRAAALLDRAARGAAPGTPSVAWASAAVALGRGRAGTVPAGPRPADPETPLLIARAALAAGGIGALNAALDSLGTVAQARDADLRLLAGLRAGAKPPAPPPAEDDPLRAYVEGLRAQLNRDSAGAAASFGRALWGHGDACRAAGEYIAALRAVKHPPDRAAFKILRAENTGCVNLRH